MCLLGHLTLRRDTYTLKSAVGKLYAGSEFFCHTLEDVPRGENIKIPKETALPTGKYIVILTMSTRFKRVMPAIITELNGYEVKKNGVGFKGSRFHGGNTHEHTESCPLIAHNRLSDDLIQGSAEKDLTKKLMEMGLKEQAIPLTGDFDFVELIIING